MPTSYGGWLIQSVSLDSSECHLLSEGDLQLILCCRGLKDLTLDNFPMEHLKVPPPPFVGPLR